MQKIFKNKKILVILSLLLTYIIIFSLLETGILNYYYGGIINLILINIILAVSLNLIVGFTGQLCLGHAAFMAIGAYSSAILSISSRTRLRYLSSSSSSSAYSDISTY